MLALVSIWTITQALATFGIAPSINALVWTYGMGYGMPILTLVYLIMLFLSYEAMYALYSVTANIPVAAAVTIANMITNEFGSFMSAMGMLWAIYAYNMKAFNDGLKKSESAEEETAALFVNF